MSDTHKNFTKDSLQEHAALGGEKLRAYIVGDAADRNAKMQRVSEAQKVLREEMKETPAELRKLIVDITRTIVQESLDELRKELLEAKEEAKAKLEYELKFLEREKRIALASELELASPYEYAVAEVRETADDVWKSGVGDGWQAAKYAGIAGVGAYIGHWLWSNTIGRVIGWFKSNPDEPTWLERLGSFASMIGGGILGVLGFRSFFRTPIGAAITKFKDGADDEIERKRKEIEKANKGTPAAIDRFMNAPWEEKLGIAISEGWPIVYENGKMLVYESVNRPIELGVNSINEVIAYFRGQPQSDDIWMLLGSTAVASAFSGAVYFLSKKALNAGLYGRLDIWPNSFADGTVSLVKIASGPLGMIYDAAAMLHTASSADGRAALKIRYVDWAAPVTRKFASFLNAWVAQPVGGLVFGWKTPEQAATAAITEWNNMRSTAETMGRHGGLFSEDDVKQANESAAATLDTLRQTFRTMPDAAVGNSRRLKALKRAAARPRPTDASRADPFEEALHTWIDEEEDTAEQARTQAERETQARAQADAEAQAREQARLDALGVTNGPVARIPPPPLPASTPSVPPALPANANAMTPPPLPTDIPKDAAVPPPLPTKEQLLGKTATATTSPTAADVKTDKAKTGPVEPSVVVSAPPMAPSIDVTPYTDTSKIAVSAPSKAPSMDVPTQPAAPKEPLTERQKMEKRLRDAAIRHNVMGTPPQAGSPVAVPTAPTAPEDAVLEIPPEAEALLEPGKGGKRPTGEALTPLSTDPTQIHKANQQAKVNAKSDEQSKTNTDINIRGR